ncbi:MAG: hypothetical protein V7K40_08815 [Nostoc sp.]
MIAFFVVVKNGVRSRKCKAIALSFTDKRSLSGVESRGGQFI